MLIIVMVNRTLSSLLAIAGAGFRLSLVLNAVGVEMALADLDVQAIAKAISLYSLMLKQVAKSLESARNTVTQSAWDTATKNADQSQKVFNEIKEITEIMQKRDEKGLIKGIAVGKRTCWGRGARAMYLMSQLEGLKLSLGVLGQVAELGRVIHETR